MKCKSTNQTKYKKPALTFLSKIADFIDKITDKITGTQPEDYLTDAQSDYVDKNFDRIRWRMRR